MPEPIDDLLAKIPPNWDFWVGSAWDDDGADIFTAKLQLRAAEHAGHYAVEVEKISGTLRAALEAAIADAPWPKGS